MRHLLIILTLGVLIIPCLLLAQETKSSGAKLVVEETAFDFGYIPAGDIVSHSYFFHNQGSDSLKILKVQPGCGCTKAPLRKEVVAVGDSTDVELVYTSNKAAHGMFSKSAMVTSNDFDNPTLQLTFKGTAFDSPDSLKPLTLSKANVAWDGQSKSQEAKIVVKNVSKSAVKMQMVSMPYGYLKIDLPDSEIKPGKDKEIKVKLDQKVTDSEFRKSFTFALSDSSHTRYTIPVTLTSSAGATQILPRPEKKPEATH